MFKTWPSDKVWCVWNIPEVHEQRVLLMLMYLMRQRSHGSGSGSISPSVYMSRPHGGIPEHVDSANRRTSIQIRSLETRKYVARYSVYTQQMDRQAGRQTDLLQHRVFWYEHGWGGLWCRRHLERAVAHWRRRSYHAAIDWRPRLTLWRNVLLMLLMLLRLLGWMERRSSINSHVLYIAQTLQYIITLWRSWERERERDMKRERGKWGGEWYRRREVWVERYMEGERYG